MSISIFHSTSWALAQQGFEIVTGMFLPSQVENVIVALIFLVNRQEKDGAICVAMHNNAPGMFQTQFHAEFVTRYKRRPRRSRPTTPKA